MRPDAGAGVLWRLARFLRWSVWPPRHTLATGLLVTAAAGGARLLGALLAGAVVRGVRAGPAIAAAARSEIGALLLLLGDAGLAVAAGLAAAALAPRAGRAAARRLGAVPRPGFRGDNREAAPRRRTMPRR